MILGKDILWHIQKLKDVPDDNNWLTAKELEKLNSFKFPKRKNDWLLGRWTVKNLLQKYFITNSLTDFEIIPAGDGAPEAFLNGEPAAASISISHSNGISLCVLDPRNKAIGCDIEAIENRDDAFIQDYFTNTEIEMIGEHQDYEKHLMVTLIWSAKESTLKALREGLRLDTRSVSVNEIALGESEDWEKLTVTYPLKQKVFDGWWRVYDEFVLTVLGSRSL